MPKRSDESRNLPAWDLKAQREKHSYTQAKAAEILCTTQATIARWEADGATPLIYRKYWEIYHHALKVKKAAPRKARVNETKAAAASA